MDPTDKDLLTEALSTDSPVDTPPADAPAADATASTERPRDEMGRFVAKAGDDNPQPDPQQPAPATTQPQAQAPATAQPAADATAPDHRIPLREHLEEREKRQKAEATLADRDRSLGDLQRQVEHLTRLLQGGQQPPQPGGQGKPVEPPNLFEAPDQWFNHQAAPLVEQVQMVMLKNQHGLSRAFASEKYGAEAVQAAEAEIMGRLRMGDVQAQYDYQKIMASPHPYGEVVNWHKTQANLKLVGSDPNAWLEAQMAERMKDPAFQAKVIEMARGQAQQNPPSNGSARPATQVQLPPSLSRTPAAMGVVADDDMDQSDAALLKQALRR